MFLKVFPNNSFFFQSSLINSGLRFWNPYNFSSLSSVYKNGITLNINVLTKQLEASFNFVAMLYSKGGRPWFYNMFFPEKTFKSDGFTTYYKDRIRFKFGLSLLTWFPGKLSNFKLQKKMRKKSFKSLFRRKSSFRCRSNRYRYISGRRRNRGVRRRHFMTQAPWRKNDPDWAFRAASRRRGHSRHVLKYAFLRYKNLFPRFYIGRYYYHRRAMKKEKRAIKYIPPGKNRPLSYFVHRSQAKFMRKLRKKLSTFSKYFPKEQKFKNQMYNLFEIIRSERFNLRRFRFLRNRRARYYLDGIDFLYYLFLENQRVESANLLRASSLKLAKLKLKYGKVVKFLKKFRRRRLFHCRPRGAVRKGLHYKNKSYQFFYKSNRKRYLKRGAWINYKLKSFPSRRLFAGVKKRFKVKNKKISDFYLSSFLFDELRVDFFNKPGTTSNMSLYDSFSITIPEEFELNGPIRPGTSENPVNLPVTAMPTTNPRRIEKKLKKINPDTTMYDTQGGYEFNSLHTSIIDPVNLGKLQYLFDPEADNYLDYPFIRYAKKLLKKRYARRIGRIAKLFVSQSYPGINTRGLIRNARETRTRVRKKYFKNSRRQKRMTKWFKKLSTFSDKLYRLHLGIPSLTFRSFSFNFPEIDVIFYADSSYRKILESFYSKFKYRVLRQRLLTINNINKPRKRFKHLKVNYLVRTRGYFRIMKPKVKLGTLVKDEKTYKKSNSKAFSKFKKTMYSPRRRALISILLDLKSTILKPGKLIFNFSDLTIFRKRRLFSGRSLYSEKYYTSKRKPSQLLRANSLLLPILETNRPYFIEKISIDKIKKLNIRSKDNKRLRLPQTIIRPPQFILRRRLKKFRRKRRSVRRVRNRFTFLRARAFKYFPSALIFSNLARLTLSVLNEAKASGVCSVFFCSGETTPVATFNIIINDDMYLLTCLKKIYKAIYKKSKINMLLSKLY